MTHSRQTTKHGSIGPMLMVFLLASTVSSGCSRSIEGAVLAGPKTLDIATPRRETRGPLRVSKTNSRYFSDNAGAIVYLTGSHTWNSLQDWGTTNPPHQMDYARYLDFLSSHGHNFFRLYCWEQADGVPWTAERVRFEPTPYQRTGTGTALDGGPRFDLNKWNPDYFKRLRSRVQEARDRGIYVSVMLFNGWSVDGKRSSLNPSMRESGLGDPWRGHPYHRDNNVNGIDGGEWGQVHTLQNSNITDLQKAYLRKVIDSVGDLDNVLWEISNESNAGATPWEYEMIRFIHEYEARRPEQHPVGMTAEYPNGNNRDLWESPADWISPGSPADALYATDPPAGTGTKVVVTDTDHIWGIGGSPDWVWKSFARGLNPIFMDPYEADLIRLYPIYRGAARIDPVHSAQGNEWEPVRTSLGYARSFAERIPLGAMTPRDDLASSHYCLSDGTAHYLIYVPVASGRLEKVLDEIPATLVRENVRVDLSQSPGVLQFEWFETSKGVFLNQGTVAGGGIREFALPGNNRGAVLYIYPRS